ncbi:hypothetical protein OG782_04795 [Streptomyces sp. NBC_00876]|uniref:hypothetical protein n=1 Tax=Streptomyces sp. NBC_00876 TaxID=2975853 RepID=UPI00386E1777|nr:hypothetical protein OG782_04795 [Streptomyces sp. NBC_00876]
MARTSDPGQLSAVRVADPWRPRPSPRGTGRGPGRGAGSATADRLPRTTAVVRKAAQAGRLMRPASAPAGRRTRLREVRRLPARTGPGLVLRTVDGIADRRPPHHTYAARTKDAPANQRWTPTGEDRDVRR